MDGHPDWHVDIDLFGDDEVIFARATLHLEHATLVGRGASRTCAGVRAGVPMGDTAAVAAALQDLGHQLAGGRAHAPKRSAREHPLRRKNHDQHAYRA